MSLRAQALEADKSRKALQTAQDASGGSKRVRRCLMYFPGERGVEPFLRYIRPLDVYIAQ